MSNIDYRVERVLDIKAQLGEAPIWSVQDQSLYWVDIHTLTINRFTPATGENRAWPLPAMPGCFALREGDGAVVAARDGIHDIDFATGAVRKLADAPFDPATHRFNDGKPDRQGRLWVGSFAIEFLTTGATGEGVMYRFDGTRLDRGFAPITVANGTAFSPDGRTMYRAESHERTVYALDYDPASGTATNERVFTRIPDGLGIPDGATVDSEGGYWVALPLGPRTGGIGRFTPDGKLDLHIEMPVLLPTCVAFGGADMSTLYVTSAREEHYSTLPLGEHAGDVFAIETPYRGIPEAVMRETADVRR